MGANTYETYKPTLNEILAQALPSPAYVKPESDAAVVALACHCESLRRGAGCTACPVACCAQAG